MKVRFKHYKDNGVHWHSWICDEDPDTRIVGPTEETKKKAKKALKKMVKAAYLELHPEIKAYKDWVDTCVKNPTISSDVTMEMSEPLKEGDFIQYNGITYEIKGEKK